MAASPGFSPHATPGDWVWHLGPRTFGPDDEGPLTLCGLYLKHMRPVIVLDGAPGSACVVCSSLIGAAMTAPMVEV